MYQGILSCECTPTVLAPLYHCCWFHYSPPRSRKLRRIALFPDVDNWKDMPVYCTEIPDGVDIGYQDAHMMEASNLIPSPR